MAATRLHLVTTPPDPINIRDALLPLAHSLHSTPSSHVVLLAAGASVSAGMPSAWVVQVDLIRDIARQRGHTFEVADGAEPGEVEVAWYVETFSEKPTYQALLGRVGQTPTERQRALRKYFEADDTDRENGVKQPSAVHRAVAELVKSGHLRIIVTLNFDTLIEQALRDVGIEPTVVSSPSAIAGMAPLHTHDVLVVHLHGQYLLPDTMRNTLDELAGYDAGENRFLERLLTDYGVVTVGWSAQHDTALRQAFEGTRCAHFSSYWVEPGTLAVVAEQLRAARGMTLLQADADTALSLLRDAVVGLSDITAVRHLSSLPVAVATAKRQLANAHPPIALHDQLNAEFTRVRSLPGLTEAANGLLPDQQYEPLLRRVEAEAAISTALVATTALWGNDATDDWLVTEVERSLRPVRAGGTVKVLRLPHLAGFLWATSAAVAAIASGRWWLFRRLMVDTTIGLVGEVEQPIATGLTGSTLYLDRPCSYPFDEFESLFTTHLGQTKAAWVDAWETLELMRMAIRLSESHGAEVDLAVQAVTRARQTGVGAADEATSKAITDLAGRVRVSRVRIRLRDHAGDDMYWPVTGLRLHQDVDRSRETHQMVEAGVLGEGFLRHWLILGAVNYKVAKAGEEIAWEAATLPGRGMNHIPDYIWLDTAQIPERDY